MNKVLLSPITRIVTFIIGYLAALSVVRALNYNFDYHIGRIIGDWVKMELVVALPLFAACAALLFVSVWQAEGGKKPRPWRKIDFFLLVVFAYGAVFLLANLAWKDDFWMNSDNYSTFIYSPRTYVLVLTVAAYMIIMALLIEGVARVRDKNLVSTLYWLQFFRLYTLKRPIGLLMALLLTSNLLCLLILCQYVVTTNRFGLLAILLNVTLLILSFFSLAALTYFSSFILTLSQEYDRANAEKIQAERFKAELITNVSHDIRTPLTAIINYVDLLKDLPIENGQFTEYVNVLDKKATRLKILISDLMEASKVGTGNLSVELREIDLGEILGQIAGEYDDSFGERSLTLVFRQPDQKVLIPADSSHLYRALENLFSNAAKYALPGTRVFAEILPNGGKPIFSLKNISQDPIDLPSDALTEQFIRGDRARNAEGSGLGLYIAKSLVELMGGHFSICVSGDLFEALIVFGDE